MKKLFNHFVKILVFNLLVSTPCNAMDNAGFMVIGPGTPVLQWGISLGNYEGLYRAERFGRSYLSVAKPGTRFKILFRTRNTLKLKPAGSSTGTPCYLELNVYAKDQVKLRITNVSLAKSVEIVIPGNGEWGKFFVPGSLPLRKHDMVSVVPVNHVNSFYIQGMIIYTFNPRETTDHVPAPGNCLKISFGNQGEGTCKDNHANSRGIERVKNFPGAKPLFYTVHEGKCCLVIPGSDPHSTLNLNITGSMFENPGSTPRKLRVYFQVFGEGNTGLGKDKSPLVIAYRSSRPENWQSVQLEKDHSHRWQFLETTLSIYTDEFGLGTPDLMIGPARGKTGEFVKEIYVSETYLHFNVPRTSNVSEDFYFELSVRNVEDHSIATGYTGSILLDVFDREKNLVTAGSVEIIPGRLISFGREDHGVKMVKIKNKFHPGTQTTFRIYGRRLNDGLPGKSCFIVVNSRKFEPVRNSCSKNGMTYLNGKPFMALGWNPDVKDSWNSHYMLDHTPGNVIRWNAYQAAYLESPGLDDFSSNKNSAGNVKKFQNLQFARYYRPMPRVWAGLIRQHNLYAMLLLRGILPEWYKTKVNPPMGNPNDPGNSGYLCELEDGRNGKYPCPNDPMNRVIMMEYMKSVAREINLDTSTRDVVIAYEIFNEPSWHGEYCYCRDCLISWQNWLRGAYKTIGNLNAAHGNKYKRFDQVPIPSMLTDRFAQKWIDFEYFRADTFSEWIELCAKALKSVDPNRIVLHSAFTYRDRRPDQLGVAQRVWSNLGKSRYIDVQGRNGGSSFYPGAIQSDIQYWKKFSPGKGLWYTEYTFVSGMTTSNRAARSVSPLFTGVSGFIFFSGWKPIDGKPSQYDLIGTDPAKGIPDVTVPVFPGNDVYAYLERWTRVALNNVNTVTRAAHRDLETANNPSSVNPAPRIGVLVSGRRSATLKDRYGHPTPKGIPKYGILNYWAPVVRIANLLHMNAGYNFTLVSETDVLNNMLEKQEYNGLIITGFSYKDSILESTVKKISNWIKSQGTPRALIVDTPLFKDPRMFSKSTDYSYDNHPSYGFNKIIGAALESPKITDPIYEPPGHNQPGNKFCLFRGITPGYENINIVMGYGHTFQVSVYPGTRVKGYCLKSCLDNQVVSEGLLMNKIGKNRVYTCNFGLTGISPSHVPPGQGFSYFDPYRCVTGTFTKNNSGEWKPTGPYCQYCYPDHCNENDRFKQAGKLLTTMLREEYPLYPSVELVNKSSYSDKGSVFKYVAGNQYAGDRVITLFNAGKSKGVYECIVYNLLPSRDYTVRNVEKNHVFNVKTNENGMLKFLVTGLNGHPQPGKNQIQVFEIIPSP